MSGKLVTRASEFDIARARALGNRYDPDVYGRFPWVTKDYGSAVGRALSLNKTRLGLFFESLLMNGGDISSIHPMGKTKRAYVQAMVRLTVQGRESVMKETGVSLEAPPVIRVNSE